MRPEEYEGEMIDPRCGRPGCDGIGSHICTADPKPTPEAEARIAEAQRRIMALAEERPRWMCDSVRDILAALHQEGLEVGKAEGAREERAAVAEPRMAIWWKERAGVWQQRAEAAEAGYKLALEKRGDHRRKP